MIAQGDHLDFRRENLRAGSTSKYKGGQLHKQSGRWRAVIWRKELERSVQLGYFDDEVEAARAYAAAALDYFMGTRPG